MIFIGSEEGSREDDEIHLNLFFDFLSGGSTYKSFRNKLSPKSRLGAGRE